MKIINHKIAFFAVTLTVLGMSLISCQKTELSQPGTASNHNAELKLTRPDVPDSLEVPGGQKLIMKAYATGVQIYEVTQSPNDPNIYQWTFIAPWATLYYDAGYRFKIGIHYVGPTWENNLGSTVAASAQVKSVQDPTAIPWLLLGAVSNSSTGFFKDVSYIQRVNTVDGLAPATGADADHLGQQDSVAYTADYYFYQPKN